MRGQNVRVSTSRAVNLPLRSPAECQKWLNRTNLRLWFNTAAVDNAQPLSAAPPDVSPTLLQLRYTLLRIR
jgi:hypothetical protein